MDELSLFLTAYVTFSKPRVSPTLFNNFVNWSATIKECDRHFMMLGWWKQAFFNLSLRISKIWWFNFANGADQILVCTSIRHAKQWNHSTQFTQHKSTSIINFQIQSFHFLSAAVCSFIEFSLFELNVIEPFIIIAITFSSLTTHSTVLVVDETRTFFSIN